MTKNNHKKPYLWRGWGVQDLFQQEQTFSICYADGPAPIFDGSQQMVLVGEIQVIGGLIQKHDRAFWAMARASSLRSAVQ